MVARRIVFQALGNVGEIALDGVVDLAGRGAVGILLHLPLGLVRVDDGGRVALEQLAADHEHDFLLFRAVHLAVVVIAEHGLRRPGVEFRNVLEPLVQRREILAGLRQIAAHVPELAEVAAALVGRVFAPQQLARHLVVEAHHVGLDELLVGLEQRDAVGRNEVEVRQEVLGVEIDERLVHRQVEVRVVHDLVDLDGIERRARSARGAGCGRARVAAGCAPDAASATIPVVTRARFSACFGGTYAAARAATSTAYISVTAVLNRTPSALSVAPTLGWKVSVDRREAEVRALRRLRDDLRSLRAVLEDLRRGELALDAPHLAIHVEQAARDDEPDHPEQRRRRQHQREHREQQYQQREDQRRRAAATGTSRADRPASAVAARAAPRRPAPPRTAGPPAPASPARAAPHARSAAGSRCPARGRARRTAAASRHGCAAAGCGASARTPRPAARNWT